MLENWLTQIIEIDVPSGQIKRRNRIAYGMDIYREWQLSVDIKLERRQNSGTSNVFAVMENRGDFDDKTHVKPMYGARLPAVYTIDGKNKLRICNYVNKNSNHCHNTGKVGTEWFNLKIGQRKEGDKYRYEIFIDGELEYSTENGGVAPETWTRPEWTKARAEFANKMPTTAKGEFKNFQFSTTRPARPESVTEYIYNLINKFDDVIYATDLRRGQKDRFQRNFQFHTESLPEEHEWLLMDDCTDSETYPETFEDDGEADKTDTCEAIDQIVNRANEWSKVFLYSCRLEQRRGEPMRIHEKYMGKVRKIANKAKNQLNC